MRIRFWGVRGSYPVPGLRTAKVGGNSSCVEVAAGTRTLIFDAGTGIIGLGRALLERSGDTAVHIFLSHTHYDHIEGFKFFDPVYTPHWRCHVYGPGIGPQPLDKVMRGSMGRHFFPVSMSELPARLSIHGLGASERIRFNGPSPSVVLARHSRAHPRMGVFLYRVNCGGRSVVYATDIEASKGGHEDVVEFARGADVLIHDAQYTDDEYFSAHLNKSGWGHSTIRMAAEVARAAEVGELLLYHHDPQHDDTEVRRLERLAKTIFPRSRAASEGLQILLPPK